MPIGRIAVGPRTRLLFTIGAVGLVLLVPFALAGQPVDRWFDQFRDAPPADGWIALVVLGLLTSDIIAPIPSSLVGAFAGVALGPVLGTVVVFSGLTLGCLVGYAASRGVADLARPCATDRWAGAWPNRAPVLAIVVARPIPLLAESTVIAAGLHRVRLARFVVACVVANLVVAIVFAAVPGVVV